MELFDYLMAKKGHNTGRDLFSYLLGKNAGGSGTYTTFSGITLNISNTVFGKIKNFMLNSTELTQDGTPSPSSPVDVNVIKGDNTINIKNKNLFNSTNWRKTVSSGGYPLPNNDYSTIVTSSTNNIEFSTLAYGGVESNFFPVKSGETYTISFSGTLPNRFFVTQYNSSKQRLSTLNSSSAQVQTTTFTTTADGYIAIGFNNTTISSDNFIINNLQLETGSTATDYVEHQEQNYPISLGGNEFEANKMSLGYYIDGLTGNLNSSGASNVSDYMEAIEGIEYTLNYSYVSLASSSSRAICYFDQNKNFIAPESPYTYNPKNKPIKITPPTNAKFVRFTLDKNITNVEFYSSNAIEYCKIGDYADQIFKNTADSPYYDNTLIENEWYLKKNIAKVFLDGTASSWQVNSAFTTEYMATKIELGINLPQNSINFLSNYFVAKGSAPATLGGIRMGGTYVCINYDNGVNGIDNFKSWLQSNNVYIYYLMSTPTYIQLSQTDYPILRSQLEDIYNNSKSYNGQTSITQTNDDLPFNISVDVLIKN